MVGTIRCACLFNVFKKNHYLMGLTTFFASYHAMFYKPWCFLSRT